MILSAVWLSLALQYSDTVVVEESRCESCSISIEHVATLGDADGPGMVDARAVIARNAKGQFLVAHRLAPSSVNVFSAQGRFIRKFGRAGLGPGEYARIWKIAPFDSGVLIYDDIAKRSSRLTNDLVFVESRPAPENPTSLVLQADGSGVMSAIVPSRDLIGYIHHEFDASGRRLRSAGLSQLPYREDLRVLFERDLSPGFDRHEFWSSHRSEYAFERCKFGSADCILFLRPASWFARPSPGEIVRQSGDTPPLPTLWGVWQEDSRYLWTIVRVADPNWRTAVDGSSSGEYSIYDWNGYVDSIIECIDLKTNQVVASTRSDYALLRFFSNGLTWYHEEDANGIVRLRVVRFKLNDGQLLREGR